MNDFEWIENQIIKWGKDKDLIGEKGNSKRQVEKTFEELNELGDALYFENTDDAIDAYGDIIVTIIIGYAQFCFEKNINHSRIIDAVNSAYEEIKIEADLH